MVIYSIPYDTITYNMSHNMSYNTKFHSLATPLPLWLLLRWRSQ